MKYIAPNMYVYIIITYVILFMHNLFLFKLFKTQHTSTLEKDICLQLARPRSEYFLLQFLEDVTRILKKQGSFLANGAWLSIDNKNLCQFNLHILYKF